MLTRIFWVISAIMVLGSPLGLFALVIIEQVAASFGERHRNARAIAREVSASIDDVAQSLLNERAAAESGRIRLGETMEDEWAAVDERRSA